MGSKEYYFVSQSLVVNLLYRNSWFRLHLLSGDNFSSIVYLAFIRRNRHFVSSKTIFRQLLDCYCSPLKMNIFGNSYPLVLGWIVNSGEGFYGSSNYHKWSKLVLGVAGPVVTKP